MNTQFAFSPRSLPISALATFRTKLREFRLEWQQARSERQKIARITHELASCTDRQLADLGLCRSEIPAVARGTYSRA